MANKRKKTTAIVAGVTAVALLLGGTFAWTSISQQAKNESAGIVNVGGRLHDDFNGENKDIYVENFTDPLNGGQPIYARIKLTEYMEVGKEAGKLDENGNYAADRNAESVVEGATIDNLDSWSIHVPADSCAKCLTGNTCQIHEHWTWVMGGQTTYMPTFNKDKDSLDADINGTYAGTNAADKIYYDDYVEYTTDDTAEGVGKDIAEADTEAYEGKIYSVVGTEYYDDDTDLEDNDGTRQVADVTHTAKETADATVMTMQAWIDAGSLPGNYWVYDTDGWAYWANPIMPGEATGLLLSNIEMIQNPGEKCYYAINVVGQFATVNDWEYFDENNDSQFDGTDNALTLLEAASKNVATVTVTNLDGKTAVKPGDTVRFSASVSTASEAVTFANADFDWTVLDKEHNLSETSSIEINDDGNAVLTVGEGSSELIIVAKATADQYLGAVGMSSVVIDTELTTTNDTLATAYALLTDDGTGNDTYDMILVRSEDEIVAGENTYNGKTIAKVYNMNSMLGQKNVDANVWSGDSDWVNKVTSVRAANTIIPGTDMLFYFHEMPNLVSADLTNIDFTNVTSVKYMFDKCSKLKNVTFPVDFGVKVTNAVGVFRFCESLETVTFPENFGLEGIECESMFYQCTNLKTVTFPEDFGREATDFRWMFMDCSSLENPGLPADFTTSATQFTGMFQGCTNLTYNCSGWSVNNATKWGQFNEGASGVIAPTWPTTE